MFEKLFVMMKIFISWSGKRSKLLASTLKVWLPDVIQQVEVWMSEHDLEAGTRWSHELNAVLEKCDFGIICLTPENQDSSWLLFESGALGKSVQNSRVVPIRLGLSTTDVKYPIAQFQSVGTDRSGVLKLLESICSIGEINLGRDRLLRLFDKWWPDLEEKINQIGSEEEVTYPLRTDRELLEEMLELIRVLTRRDRKREGRIHFSLENLEMANPHPPHYVCINCGPYLNRDPYITLLEYVPEQPVSNFLDDIYFFLNTQENVPPFTYGSEWLLEDDKTRKVYDFIGTDYISSQGAIRDSRSIAEVGIKDRDILNVIRA